jgi:HlyD family secretion protein
VLVREGDRVKAGQPLLVLEPGDLEAQRLIAEGQLKLSL